MAIDHNNNMPAADRLYLQGWQEAEAHPGRYIPECWSDAEIHRLACDLAIAALDADLAQPALVRSPRRDSQIQALKKALDAYRRKA